MELINAQIEGLRIEIAAMKDYDNTSYFHDLKSSYFYDQIMEKEEEILKLEKLKTGTRDVSEITTS